MATEIKGRANLNYRSGPIRTYREVVEIMRKRGDVKITTSMIHWYERSALNKLRVALADLRDEL